MQDDHSVSHFIKYNNAVPLILGALFLSTSATLAASPEVRDSVYSSAAEIKNIDNSYLISVNLDEYPFSMRVTSVEEDEEWYYLSYELDTIDVLDGAWQDVTYQKVLRVSKALLRDGDLRIYAETELAQVRDQEFRLLSEAKERESGKGITQKTVATVHTGLIGRLIEPSEETLPFYQPPVAEQAKDDPLRVKKPIALVTWDANAKKEDPAAKENDENTGPRDYCPDMAGIQETPLPCHTLVPPSEPPPAVEPPAEEPAPEPMPEPEPEPEPAPTPTPAPEPTPEPAPEEETGTGDSAITP